MRNTCHADRDACPADRDKHTGSQARRDECARANPSRRRERGIVRDDERRAAG